MSDRVRHAREAAEARRTEAKKTAAKPPRARPKPPLIPVRVKIVWELCSGTGKTLKTFPYPEKAAAEAQARALTWSTGRAHTLRATKVPME